MGTPSPNICSDSTYLNLLNQKSRFQLFNIPPNRYNNLANNPYASATYTKFDLDMRRKAEILKYSSNRMTTQTNSLTKSQIYAQAVNGASQQRRYSQAFIAANTQNGIVNLCPPGTIIKTPSSASDVPGNLLLYEDDSVPLYNFMDDTADAYGIINQELNPYSQGFKYTNETDIIYTDTARTIFTLYMFNTTLPNYTFSFTTPIIIEFYGAVVSQIPTNNTNLFQVIFSSVSTNINYSYSTINSKSTITSQLNNMPIPTNILDVSLNSDVSYYSGSFYLGTITFSNITLPVALGYIYDFKLSVNFAVSYPINSTYSTYYNSPTFKTVFNVSDTPLNRINCSITPTYNYPAPPIKYSPLIVSGVPSV
jgi:hypothetical protein